MTNDENGSDLLDSVIHLRSALDAATFPLPVPGSGEAAGAAHDAIAQLDDHIIARLTHLDAPALVVVGGSTGAGKSTLINSLIGSEVTRSGVLRPTTSDPVLICNPASTHWFDDRRILPGLARLTSDRVDRDTGANTAAVLELVGTEAIAPVLAIVDAPDFDSVVERNRDLAAQLLDAADIWLFVTTAARYADAVPWEFLRRARDRATAMTIVLNRVPPGAIDSIRSHLEQLLAREGIGDVTIFAIEEQSLEHGRIPAAHLAGLQGWLQHLSTDHAARTAAVRRTLQGALAALVRTTGTIADAVASQHRAFETLGSAVASAYDGARSRLAADVSDGAVLRGEVLARWQDMIGTGELLRQLQSSFGRVRDRLTSMVTGRALATAEFAGAIESGMETLTVARASEAAREAYESWRTHTGGSHLLAATPHRLDLVSPDCKERSARAIRDWQGGILDLLQSQGRERRTTAKALSYGVNGLAAVLMITVFAHTGGLTGAEVAIAGGSSAVGQRLLMALLGDQVVRDLAELARVDLDRRIGEVLDAEAGRYLEPLARTGLSPDAEDRIRAAVARVDSLR